MFQKSSEIIKIARSRRGEAKSSRPRRLQDVVAGPPRPLGETAEITEVNWKKTSNGSDGCAGPFAAVKTFALESEPSQKGRRMERTGRFTREPRLRGNDTDLEAMSDGTEEPASSPFSWGAGGSGSFCSRLPLRSVIVFFSWNSSGRHMRMQRQPHAGKLII
ncbi:hypothetical protein EYF80_036896 [Liparis tanakae]|uniref:Uncharacterized protein n=1 Tax=Liparis tanakae TaxID=230148 RepID=A0A4Z2GJ41_9TELE|nr:hypothetical protein EYF80_036896 [Liparis tanakae]